MKRAVGLLVAFGAAACCAGTGGFFDDKSPYVINVGANDSLLQVRDRVRSLPAQDRLNGVEIRLAAARYELDKTFLLESCDSGATAAPVVWRGASGGGTILTSGRNIPVQSFKPDSGRPGVLVADISSWNLPWPKRPKHECRNSYPIPELFVDGERFTIAGWPDWPTVASPGDTNGGWTAIASFVDKGSRYGDDGKFYDCNSHEDLRKMTVVKTPWPGIFGYSGDRPSKWKNAESMVLHGFWTFDWAESKIPVKSIDTNARTIALAYPHCYGLRQGNPSARRWRAINLLEELDRPGEYFVDTQKSLVYIMPRRALGADAQITVTWADRSIIKLKGASRLAFADIEIFGSWGHGIEAEDISDVAFANLNIHGIRNRGLEIRRPLRCAVSSCEIYDTGNGGIGMYDAGERRTLSRGDNVIDNCLIYGFSKNRLTSAHAIELTGCGNGVRHNEMFDAPHQAVRMQGNDNIFEYNVISNVLQCTDDAGALYTGRNPACRGNIIRYNHFADIGSDRGHGNAAIYFDDGDGGNEVFGCLFVRCGAPGKGRFGTVFSHGGYSNTVHNCLFVDCKRPLGSSPWVQKQWEKFLKLPYMVKRLKVDIDIESEVYLSRYPELKGYLPGQADELRWNYACDNVFVNAREILRGRWATNTTNVATLTLAPGERNAACASLVPGFAPIPYGKIGRQSFPGNRKIE